MSTAPQRKPPKGGRKGGTVFPKMDLKQAHKYATKLVSKTHTGAQPEKIILKGVFNNAGSGGKVRVAALKQFNLIEGDPNAYQASKLAKGIVSSPPDELNSFLVKACLSPKIFKTLFDTFKNDKVTTAKIKQQAIQLDVHPDSADKCIEIFVNSLVYSGLAKIEQDSITISEVSQDTTTSLSSSEDIGNVQNADAGDMVDKGNINCNGEQASDSSRQTRRHMAQVNISIDPSMDPEKLEKLLKLLKQYGAI